MNYKILRREKKRKEEKKIKKILSVQHNKDWIEKYISDAISDMYKENKKIKKYFSPKYFFDFFERENQKNIRENFKKAKLISIAVRLSRDININFDSFFVKNLSSYISVEESLKNFLKEEKKDFLLGDVFKMLSSINSSYNLAEKISAKKRNNALNKTSKGDKLGGLSDALKTSPWGSDISFLIVRDLILLIGGEKIGK